MTPALRPWRPKEDSGGRRAFFYLFPKVARPGPIGVMSMEQHQHVVGGVDVSADEAASLPVPMLDAEPAVQQSLNLYAGFHIAIALLQTSTWFLAGIGSGGVACWLGTRRWR